MQGSLVRSHLALVTALLMLLVPLAADAQVVSAIAVQPVVCQPTPATQLDNRDGYFVNLEEGPIAPLLLLTDRKELWAVSLSDASVAVFNAQNPLSLVRNATIKVGLGPVALAARPPVTGPGEVWVVCQSSNAVVIVDRSSRRLLDSIRLTSEPSGIVFDATGGKAWVSLAATNQVVEIDATNRTVLNTLEFGTPFPLTTPPLIHVEEPRALLLDGSALYALSFEGGNGTLPLLGTILDDTIVNLWQFYNQNNIPPPPDRDVLRFSVPGANPAAVALWRTGGINFDLKKDSAGELWVSNMDFNNLAVGEFQFPNGGIARHRVTHAPPLPAGALAPLTAPPSIDLNAAALPALVSQGYACSMPNQMAFTANFHTLYVACNDTHNVAVLDVPSQQVIAELRGLVTMPTGAHQSFGVRGLALWEANGALYSYSRDNRIQVYAVPVASGSVNAPVQSVAIGFDIAQPPVKEGRFHHMNALRSTSRVQSCNTCHVDGHLDRIAWNLSDFTGDLTVVPPLGRVPKGTKVTMSLRGIEETPPFHWRGDRSDLFAFKPAFVGLLGAPAQLSAAEMADFERFIFSLSYPPNRKEQLDRTYSPLALQGAQAFNCVVAHNVRFDDNPAGPLVQGVSCQFCHGMAGSSATNNQVNNDIDGHFADDATQLRGLFDKESDIVDYSVPPYNLGPPLNRVPATGWGFGNTGSFADTLTDFVNLGPFLAGQLTQTDRDNIVIFLNEFDSGMAPAAAYAWTLNRGSAGSLNQPFNTLLQSQANQGHIDLVIRGWMFVAPATRNIGMLYNPATGLFDTDTTGVGPFSYAQLVSTASAGRGAFLLVGTPPKSGYRLGLDEEMDFALDGNEPAAGAVVGSADTDADGFPDGYEMRLGSNPNSGTSVPPAETVAPNLTPAPVVSWVNSKVAKLRWGTDEEATSRIEVQPAGVVLNPPLMVKEDLQFKRQHVLVVRGLQPGQVYDFYVRSTDPAMPGNTGQVVLASQATQNFDFQSTHLVKTSLTKTMVACGSPVPLTATFQIADETGAAVNGATVTFTKVEWTPGGGNVVTTGLTAGPSAGGLATASLTSTLTACTPGATVEVFATDVTGTNRLYFHPLDGQFGFWGQVGL